MKNKDKKVFVSGCFDLLHNGHVAFLKSAASFGTHLSVCIGADETVYALKNRFPANSQDERKYHLEAIRFVDEVLIGSASGMLDFLPELEKVKPDVFVVNEDGHQPEKEAICAQKGIEYKVLKRLPEAGLPARSTTAIRKENRIPFRLDLAGGWLDQPFVSSLYPGPVITLCIEPDYAFNTRSGMASSTRAAATELWEFRIPEPDTLKAAKTLFAYENPPGTQEIAGSQDAIGIVFTGLNKLSYSGNYWPDAIEQVQDLDVLQFLQNHLYLVSLEPRASNYSVLENTHLEREHAKALSIAAEKCWNSILQKDLSGAGNAMTESFKAQLALFPNMGNEEIFSLIRRYEKDCYGYKLSGAGGGGYLILLADKQPVNSIQIRIRRKEELC
ncbi:MAG: adenylyltransferase/cytidyltransferase family protein [Bacteroidetes bacterium]|nr:adenylyltransferase/cytidyltransferase family protein [Bacteroidota bacterium]